MSWTSVSSVQGGLPDSVLRQRFALFGSNVIDIQGKSTTTLLVEEVRFSSIPANRGSLNDDRSYIHSMFFK